MYDESSSEVDPEARAHIAVLVRKIIGLRKRLIRVSYIGYACTGVLSVLFIESVIQEHFWSAALQVIPAVISVYVLCDMERKRRQYTRFIYHLQRIQASDPAFRAHWEQAKDVLEQMKK